MTSAETQAQTLLAFLGDLSQNSDRESSMTRFMEAFLDLWPDVHGHFTKDACAKSPEVFPVECGDSQFGCLVLDDVHELRKEELPLIRHALSLLGLILKKEEQETLLKYERHAWQVTSDEEIIEEMADREKIETPLRKSQAHLSIIFENTRDLQLLVRYEGPKQFRIVEVNHAYIDACNQYGLGLTVDDIVGQTLDDTIINILGLDEPALQDTLNKYQQAIDTGAAVRYDENLVVLGKPYHSTTTLSPIQKATDNHQYVVYNSRNVTAEKEALLALENVKSFFENVMENVQDGIWVTDRHDVIFYVNQGMEGIAGVPKEQLVGNNVLEDFPKTTTEKFNVFYRHAKHDLTPTWYEVTVKTPAGRNIWQNGWLVPILRDGRFDGMICTVRDVTERKNAERELEKNESRYRHLVETASDAIYLMDERGLIIDTNRMASQMLQKSREEIVGSPIDTVDPNFPIDVFLAFWKPVPYEEQKIFETTHMTKHGDLIPIEISGKKFQFDEKTYYFGVARNILARKASENALKQQRDFLELIMNAVPTRIFWKDRNCIYLGCNTAFAKDTGLESPEEVIGKTDESLVWKVEADRYRADDRLVMRTGNPKLQSEKEFLNHVGERVVWRTSKMPLRNADGEIIGVVATSENITEKKRTADQLHASEAKFRSYVDNAPDGIFVADERGKYLEVNPAACEITGYSQQELLRMSLSDLLSKEDIEKGIAHFQKTRKTGIARGELGFVTKGGEKRFWHVAAVKLSGHRFLGFVKDITEWKKAEEALRKSELKFRALFEQAGGYCMILDPNTDNGIPLIVDANQAALDSHGYTREEFIGRPVADIDDEDGKKMVVQLTRMVMSGEPFYVENTHVRKDGSTFPVAVNAKRIDIEGERPLIFTIEYDISERKKAEDQLKKSEEQYRLLAENSSDAVSLLNADGTLVYVSPAYSRLIGHAEDEMVPLDIPGILQRLHPGDRARISEEIRRGRELKLPTSQYQYRVKTKHGQYIWLEDVLRRQFDEHGRLIQTIVNSHDISERKHAEKAIRESEEKFRALFAASPIPTYIWQYIETDFVLRDYNAAALRFTEGKIAEIVGIHASAMYREDEQALQDFTHCFQQQSTIEREMEYQFKATGDRRYLSVKYTYVPPDLLMVHTEDFTTRKQAEDRLKASLAEKEVLLRELYHRTKNNMNVIQSILALQAAFSRNDEVERIAKEVGDKIQAMALVHQKLYQSQNLSCIPLHEYLPELVELLQQSYTISPASIAVRLDVAPVFVLIDTAIPCGLTLNELMSNIFKHAFPDDRNGEIRIQLTEDDQGLITLQVSDNGVGVPPGFDFRAQDSLGLQSLVMIAEHQLQGTVTFTGDDGVTCRIQFTDTSYHARV